MRAHIVRYPLCGGGVFIVFEPPAIAGSVIGVIDGEQEVVTIFEAENELSAIVVFGLIGPMALVQLEEGADEEVRNVVQARDRVHSEGEFTSVDRIFVHRLKMGFELLFLAIAFIDSDMRASDRAVVLTRGQGVAFVKASVCLALAVLNAEVFLGSACARCLTNVGDFAVSLLLICVVYDRF